jgi:hypothetical protein
MTVAWFRHPTMGFTLPIPGSWETIADVPGVALIAVEPARGESFRPNLVVTAERVTEGVELGRWATAGDEALGEALHRHLWLDDGEIELNGRRARRTLSAYTSPENHSVTMEQWTFAEGTCGYTITASVWTLEYDALAEVFEEIVGRFQPDPGYAP